jgi:tripartite-type tricarboxylate transporter receptor subunit TctC
MQRRQILRAAGAATAAVLASPQLLAQQLPNLPIRLVVGFPPGGGADALARVVAQKLAVLWDRQVIVENKAGASSTMAADYMLTQPADGSALLVSNINSHALAPAVRSNLRYHADRDFAPVALLGVTPNLLITSATNPVKSLAEVVAQCKAQPGKISFGSAGPGTIQHFAIELFKLQAGIDALHVPYKGSGPLLTDLIGGQIHYTFETMTAATPHVQNGRVVALAQTRAKRSQAYPEVRTMQEQGFPTFETMNWYGISGPAKLAPGLARKINQDINTVLGMADVREKFAGFGVEGGGGSVEQYGEFTRSELAKWAKVAKDAKVTIDG